jgi:hypothetical protein
VGVLGKPKHDECAVPPLREGDTVTWQKTHPELFKAVHTLRTASLNQLPYSDADWVLCLKLLDATLTSECRVYSISQLVDLYRPHRELILLDPENVTHRVTMVYRVPARVSLQRPGVFEVRSFADIIGWEIVST